MTAPLTERLDTAINAVYTADEGTSSYRLDDDTRALLREAKAALEEQFLVRWQLDDIRRQMEEARAEGDWPLAKVIGRAETAEAALEQAEMEATGWRDAVDSLVRFAHHDPGIDWQMGDDPSTLIDKTLVAFDEMREAVQARLRDLADAARELIDGHGDEQLALNVLADALDAYDRDALAGTDGGER